MGQPIQVSSTVIDDIAMFDTDRSITGQDGVDFAASGERDPSSFPGRLAGRLFEAVPGVDHVFLASNQVVVRRPHGWDDEVVAAAAKVIADFFLFYPDG